MSGSRGRAIVMNVNVVSTVLIVVPKAGPCYDVDSQERESTSHTGVWATWVVLLSQPTPAI